MPTYDAIQLELSAPIDWEQFESLVYEILLQDDFPRLRKLGGVGDQGADAVQETFYEDQSRLETVVQITSQKAQLAKFEATVQRLQEAGLSPRLLVLVFRHPVSSRTRLKIQSRSADLGLAVDPRDQSYLVGQLGKPGSSLFARYFKDIRSQVDALLGRNDPLDMMQGRLRHAMLASLAAYVAQPRSRLARSTLFDKMALAAVVAESKPATEHTILAALRDLLPGERVERSRVHSAIARLVKQGACKTRREEQT